MITQFASFLTAFSLVAQAETLLISLPITEKNAEHLYTDIIANSGADSKDFPYKNYKIPLAKVSNINTEDLPIIKKITDEWLEKNINKFKDLRLDMSGVELTNNRIHILGRYTMNPFYKLRDDYGRTLKNAKTTSGKKYTLQENCRGRLIASLPVAFVAPQNSKTLGKFAVDTLRDRLRQNDSIYPNSYFEAEFDLPKVVILN